MKVSPWSKGARAARQPRPASPLGACMKVFVLDAHVIYRRGLVASLAGVEDVEAIGEARAVDESWAMPALAEADVVVVDPDVEGGYEFIRDVRERTGAQVVICSATRDEQEVLTAVQAGAVGFLCKDTLSTETLAAGVRAAATGAGVMPPELLGALLQN